MEEALLLMEEYQIWIYLVLGLAGIIYLHLSIKWYAELRRSIFGLERERAMSKIGRSAAMLALVTAGAIATFIVVTFVVPSVPLSAIPTAVPTISLLTTSVPLLQSSSGEVFQTATPRAVEPIDESGCANPVATLTSPAPGEALRGVVEIKGTAKIPNFAFYKIEYIHLVPGAVWRAISAGTETKEDEILGTWDTSLVMPGDYGFRLVVTDTAGNAPLPCEILVSVLPSE